MIRLPLQLHLQARSDRSLFLLLGMMTRTYPVASDVPTPRASTEKSSPCNQGTLPSLQIDGDGSAETKQIH